MRSTLLRLVLLTTAALAPACADEKGSDDASPDGAGASSGTGGTTSGACSADGCPLTLSRTGMARQAGQLVAEDLSFYCGEGNSEKVTFGVKVECGTVTRPEGSTAVLDALVAYGTAAVFAGWTGDCIPVADNPERATLVLDGPKSCSASFDCPEHLDVWSAGLGWSTTKPPRCDSSRPRRTACEQFGPAGSLIDHFASTDPEATPEIPAEIQAWWDAGLHCVFECPADRAAVNDAISELLQNQPVTSPWYGYFAVQQACCALC